MENSYLIFGNGFLGNKFHKFFQGSVLSKARINDKVSVIHEINKYNPTHVINCVGKTGTPNVDWCESHRPETVHSNVVVSALIAAACSETSTRMVHVGSGCIYQGDNNDRGFSEEDEPNFFGSHYSRTKIISEKILKEFPVLQLRIRIPFTGEPHPKNLFTKLFGFDKVLICPNSMTYIDDLMLSTEALIRANQEGIFNVTNPGSMTYDRVIEAYEEFSGKKFPYTRIDESQLSGMTLAKSSNCILSTDKLSLVYQIDKIETAIRKSLKRYVEAQAA